MDFNKNLDVSMEWLYKQGAFLTSSFEEKDNTMTISWGSIGYMWRRPVFMALVRPQRYTYEFINQGNDFTISIPYEDNMKNALLICGSISGRNADKESEANIKFIPSNKVTSSIIDNCNMYYECKKLYSHEVKTEDLPEEIRNTFYGSGDTHILYFGEIVDCYEK